ncbi:cytochrome c peroxidase, mitochondrial [Cryptococcus wingfieldii CBS 7118]|uniref:Peroxidase n=1 Tax=Cryptococcus wingfieldii CBS 7118 TaxID=1295528 RepID=A0A1E3JWH7_9TREE|nr:cytochrome c peroxidase, mitochondrial [Cryptococcus wingfieldii CBS 7118]ODO05221.1 cytochrome c peroxidase, mitochondrial [Cryptococcus wingfieldii CBS 7118]
MSFRPAMLRTALGRRANPALNLKAPVLRRRFATEGGPEIPKPSPPGASATPYLLAGVGAAALGAAYYFYGTSGTPKEAARTADTAVRSAAATAEGKTGLRRGQEEYQKVYDHIADTLEKEGYDDGSLAPVLIRLAWHASGTYNKEDGTGGSNYATMRFEPEAKHGANNGLNVAREHLQKIKEAHPWISYGDLWTLAGVAAIQECGGPVIPWRPGRIDGFAAQVTPDGRLPDASQAQDHLRSIFYRMGFNDQEIVALSGAHAMGRCHTDRSGFDGPWTFSPVTFSNQYFALLKDEPWLWRKWCGPAQYEDKKTKTLMMLPTDMALVKDKSFKKWVDIYAEDEEKFFSDFSKAFGTLIELGVPEKQWAGKPWTMGSQ